MKILSSLMALAVGATALAQDAPRWPRTLTVEKGTLVLYQPQLEKLEGRTLSGRAAVSWEAKGAQPAFGVIWFDSQVLIDKGARDVQFETVKVTKVRFPNIKPEQERALAKLVETEVPKWDVRSSLDEIQDAVAVNQREVQASEQALRSTPPVFIFSNDPAVLLLYDGEPVTRPLQGSSLERVVNTQLFVVRDPATQRYYLTGGKFWYEATAPLGPFQPVAAPSAAVQAFVAKNPPPPPGKDPSQTEAEREAVKQEADAMTTPPRIVVATQPTELIVFGGPPNYVPVGDDADLLYADNSDSKVVVYAPTSETFVLASGRWFKAKTLAGPWDAVRPDLLPPAFQKIPADSIAGEVLPFVPGTLEAENAVADAQIPQTAAIRRDTQFSATYDGEPQFKQIEGTEIRYATNSPNSVLWDSGAYWACAQAVWYMAPSPTGPWVVSDRRPPSIDKIPPSVPIYNVRYVYVYQTTPEVVYVGYLPGYVGVHPYYGTVVYGTGYYYPPYIGPTYYYAYPATYGVHMAYTPYYGFAVGMCWGAAYMRMGMYYGGMHGYYGPAGYRPPYYGGGYRPPYYGGGYRPPAGGYPPGGTRPPSGGGGGHPVTPVAPGGGGGGHPVTPVAPGGGGGGHPVTPGQQPATGAGQRPSAGQQPATGAGQRPSAGQQPATGAGQRPSTGNIYNRPENANRNASRESAGNRASPSPSTRPNNVYGDKSGNVYRQNQGGNWDKNTGKGWQSQGGQGASTRPAPSHGGGAPSGLGGDAAARNRSSGSSQRSGGGYSGGGGSRGGGGHGGGRAGGGGRGGGGGRR